jgi:hypothetical protein
VLVIIGVLAHILLDRLTTLEQETERLEVELTVRHINTGIKLAVGERIMHGQESGIANLIDENPLSFLGQPAKVGAGETASTLDSWHYEPDSRTLTYRPRQPESFGGRDLLRWRYTSHTDELERTVGLRLEALK